MKLQSILKSATAPFALSVALAANPVFAQENDVGVSLSEDNGEVILVTGSRIQRPEIATASPIVAVTAENIAQSGKTNITELLTQLPALFNSEDNFDAAGSQARTGAAGVNLLDLRNLGANRTLVLIDGRRHVAGIAGEAAVDINTIPVGLIERVDVLTGGVSPIYGADGVSGVVNFVMKRDFEGFDVRAQQGISDFGDAESTYFSAIAGTNFADDRANLALSYEYRRDERVGYGDRPNGRDDAFLLIRNPDDIPDDPDVFDNVFLNNIGWADSSVDGALVIDGSFVPAFRGGGQPYDPGTPLAQSGFRATGGDNTPVASYQGDLQAQTEHHSVNAFFNYELTNDIRFFAEGKYVNSNNFTVAQPSFDFFTYVSEDNPLIPDTVRAAGLDTFGGLLFNRDNFDFGTRDETIERDVYRTVFGVEGDLTDYTQFEISYVFGQNDTRYLNDDNRIEDRYFASLDAVDEGAFLTGTPNGNVVCRVSLDGGAIVDAGNGNYGLAPQTFAPNECVPLNVFGENVASPEALNFILADLENQYTITQYVVNAFVSGNLGNHFELPGGPISYAVGGEYRAEKSATSIDPLAKQTVIGDPLSGVLADASLQADERGQFDVWEAFAEVNIPLLADMPFAELLDVSAAIRFSEYSTIGSTTSWSVRGQYSPIRDITFRGSYAESVRAPNISELFSPRSGTFLFLNDPCDPTNIANGTSFRADNCAALLDGFGIDLADFDYQSDIASSASIEGQFGGNSNLSEEKAKTWTAGLILQPSFLPGFSLTGDWYDIEISDAVNTATLTQTAEFCVDSASLDNRFCDQVTRDPTTGFVASYFVGPENIAFLETSGADFTANYRHILGSEAAGAVTISGTVGYLDTLSFIPANGGTVNDDRGELGAPKWTATADVFWQNDNFSINYGLQYIGDQLRYSKDTIAGNPDIAAPEYITIDDRIIHDARVEYRTDSENFSVFGGVNNFTNEMPARGTINSPTGWLGRYFFVGVRLRSDVLGF